MPLEDILNRASITSLLNSANAVKPWLTNESRTVRGYLASLIHKLKPNQLLIINPEYNIIPGSSLHALHKLNLIKMRRYDSLDDAVFHKATPENLFVDFLNNLVKIKSNFGSIDNYPLYIGWDWQGIMHTSREYRVVYFTENYQAQLMLRNATKEQKNKVNPYIGDRGELKKALEMALEVGGQVDVTVPSLSEKSQQHSFLISSFPLVEKKDERSYHWFNLRWNHVCKEQEFYPLHYGRWLENRGLRKGAEMVADAHVIFGFKIAKQRINDRDYGAYAVEDPFFEYDNYALNILNKLHTQVIKGYFVNTKTGRKIKYRFLNNGEINPSFGDVMLYNLRLKAKNRNPGKLVFKMFFK